MVQTLDGPRLQHVEDQARLGRLRTHMRPEQDQFGVKGQNCDLKFQNIQVRIMLVSCFLQMSIV